MGDEEIIPHMFHEHPLTLIPNPAAETDYSWANLCYGCRRYFLAGEAVYGCSQKCGFLGLLHKECMEMPREIRHPLHPSHSLTLQHSLYDDIINRCAVCEGYYVVELCYKCIGGCEFLIHLRCAGGFDEAVVDDNPTIKHPSHPQHLLKFSKKTRWCSFPCDACGATHKGNSYICTICDYWIHESCALLPESAHFPHHRPDHSLSLAFHTPYEYILYYFVCAICSGPLRMRCWIYHCQICSYVVHINCASLSPSDSFNNEIAVDDEKGITKGPIDDIYEEIIRPFVKRERGQIFIPHDHDNQNIDGKYKFNNHHHLLSFTTFSTALPSSSSHNHNHEKEEDDNDDDDEDNSIPRSVLFTCDGCTLPIHEKKQTDDDYVYENGYMSCDECKYFLHLSCFNLPPHLPSLPLHPFQNHKFTLRNAGKLTDWEYCSICWGLMNGLFYECTQCYFNIDIKCASLPNTIKHAAHPRHNLHLNLVKDSRWYKFCGVCYDSIYTENVLYRCNSCKFCMCSRCVLLPAQNKHRLEKHPLRLTYDAYVNHPGEFYCSSCEVKMNPRKRMYYCRDCDQSFHPECIPARSGEFRNIKYGMQQYVIPTLHHHPLRFQIITKKKRCDLCHAGSYDKPGFQCVSCYFVMCWFCSGSHMNALKPI
ncbi:uncharacterized protein LOC130987792 [Salvia miltiorrhiza]|uniref:uncharacterized protein LOC130987792 n=1 Tax=Salvia miltiorrhiza TaxID=226208 RepID=UPI0025AC7460|nr:uncharacterized protein LOC130987792 [Salvia miltiorrhiza]